jgi:hypothetical protein
MNPGNEKKKPDLSFIRDALHNDTIRFGTYIPKDSPFISMGRKVKILGPEKSVEIVSYGERIIPDLIALLRDEDRDWAAHVVLSSITGGDAMTLSVFADNVEEWRRTHKNHDLTHWKSYGDKTKQR